MFLLVIRFEHEKQSENLRSDGLIDARFLIMSNPPQKTAPPSSALRRPPTACPFPFQSKPRLFYPWRGGRCSTGSRRLAYDVAIIGVRSTEGIMDKRTA